MPAKSGFVRQDSQNGRLVEAIATDIEHGSRAPFKLPGEQSQSIAQILSGGAQDNLGKDPHFPVGLSQAEMLELVDKERNGCQLTVVRLLKDSELEFACGVVGEGEIPADSSDFRNSIDLIDFEERQAAFDFVELRRPDEPCYDRVDGLLVVRHCTREWVEKLQKIGCIAIELVKDGIQEFYDLFFPIECQEQLLLA